MAFDLMVSLKRSSGSSFGEGGVVGTYTKSIISGQQLKHYYVLSFCSNIGLQNFSSLFMCICIAKIFIQDPSKEKLRSLSEVCKSASDHPSLSQ